MDELSTTTIAPQGCVSLLPRWAHFLYARVLGHLWSACPLCGAGFGSHERRKFNGNIDSLPVPGGALCPRCTRDGRAHATSRDREGAILRIGYPVNVSGTRPGIFMAPAVGGSGNILVWLLDSRELVTLPVAQVALTVKD
jgi:hypothetical protein